MDNVSFSNVTESILLGKDSALARRKMVNTEYGVAVKRGSSIWKENGSFPKRWNTNMENKNFSRNDKVSRQMRSLSNGKNSVSSVYDNSKNVKFPPIGFGENEKEKTNLPIISKHPSEDKSIAEEKMSSNHSEDSKLYDDLIINRTIIRKKS
jgi:hypothetical protein